MATVGGGADKLGNIYESLWTIDQLLQLVTGESLALQVEPLELWESQGIEFQVKRQDGTQEYWSSKRQLANAAGWTLNNLTKVEPNGRSILGDLLKHIESASNHRAVFVSAMAAANLSELCSVSTDEAVFKARLRQSNVLEGEFRKYIVAKLCNGDEARALHFLRNLRIRTMDEGSLEDQVRFVIRTLFYRIDDQTTDPVSIRGHLETFLRHNIHRWIGPLELLSTLEQHKIHLRDWAFDASVTNRVTENCSRYAELVKAGFIQGECINLINHATLPDPGLTGRRKTLVVADAGGGKSCALAATVERFLRDRRPVLTIRFDSLPEGVLSTKELGQKLGFPESPAIVLAGVSNGGPCLLVVDQLDAISMASGRRTELWSVFDALRREAERFPRMSILVACRAFDLENDHRIRSFVSETGGFNKVILNRMTVTQIDDALRKAGIDPARVTAPTKDLLALPLHLWMYLTLPMGSRDTITGREELFDLFWKEKERRVVQRVGRKVQWTEVITTLSDWLSNHQQLSAPPEVLDEHALDADVMISEHVLTQSEGRYRFFHESFFDYAFARGFVRRGHRLLDLLVQTEQHLFRRAQVRQILTYLRMKKSPNYLSELEAILLHKKVRFHILRVTLQWLDSLADPTSAEGRILEKVAQCRPELQADVAWMGAGNVAWFDVRDKNGSYSAALSSADDRRVRETVRLLSVEAILVARSHRVAELLRQHRKPTDFWNVCLWDIYRLGRFYHDRALVDMFIAMIDEGAFDPSNASGFHQSSFMYELPKERPEYACEIVARCFDRGVFLWRRAGGTTVLEHHLQSMRVREWDLIEIAGGACRRFVELMLPRVADLVEELAKPHEEFLHKDPLWSCRAYADDPHNIASAILVGLAQAMESIASSHPDVLRILITPYLRRPHDAIAYLVLRAYVAAPPRYADDTIDYIIEDQRRLHVGYQILGSSVGSETNYVSCRAIEVASSHCSDVRFAALEKAILSVSPIWESMRPQSRGQTQLELLSRLDPKRLTISGQAALHTLLAKFPDYQRMDPQPMRAVIVASPVSARAYSKMTDDHWLKAMRDYSGVDYRDTGDLSGGGRELAVDIQQQVKQSPSRFVALAERMPDDLPSFYFDAILMGISGYIVESKEDADSLDVEGAVRLIRRVHKLPGQPCGRYLSLLVDKLMITDWPDDVLNALAWYAMHDPDPRPEHSRGREGHYDGDPYIDGLNSTRGAAAVAIAHILFQCPERREFFCNAIESLVHDPSVAVRTCAVEVLLAVLRASVSDAVGAFGEVIKTDPAILATSQVHHFIHYAGYHDYPGLRGTILTMLESSDPKIVEIAASQITILDLTRDVPTEDVERVRGGSETMRKAAADVYAKNVTNKHAGPVCRDRLVPFFSDPSADVRSAAAHALGQLSALDTADQAKLLTEFLHTKPGVKMMGPVMWELEKSHVKLPDLVCQICEMCLSYSGVAAEDGSPVGPRVASHLPKVVVHLYSQTESADIQSRCLDMIDSMEREHLYGIGEELRNHDR